MRGVRPFLVPWRDVYVAKAAVKGKSGALSVSFTSFVFLLQSYG